MASGEGALPALPCCEKTENEIKTKNTVSVKVFFIGRKQIFQM
jgi:hypothetical protein